MDQLRSIRTALQDGLGNERSEGEQEEGGGGEYEVHTNEEAASPGGVQVTFE